MGQTQTKDVAKGRLCRLNFGREIDSQGQCSLENGLTEEKVH